MLIQVAKLKLKLKLKLNLNVQFEPEIKGCMVCPPTHHIPSPNNFSTSTTYHHQITFLPTTNRNRNRITLSATSLEMG